MQNVRVLRDVQNRRSKLEVAKNVKVSQQVQYFVILKSLLESWKRLFCETVVDFGSATLQSFREAVAGLRMPRIHVLAAGAVLAS